MEAKRSPRPEYRVVVLGKVGSGKSTVCNKLLTGTGQGPFTVYSGLTGDQTTEFSCHGAAVERKLMEVVDSPDVFNMGYTEHQAKAKFKTWRESVNWDVPTIFVLTVRLRERFTPDDDKLYRQYLGLLPDQWSNNVIVALTFTDGLQERIEEEVECSPANVLPGLTEGRYVVFCLHDSTNTINQNRIQIMGTLHACQNDRIGILGNIKKFVCIWFNWFKSFIW